MGPGGVRGARGFLGKGVVALCSASCLCCYFYGAMCGWCFAISGQLEKKRASGSAVPSNKWQDDGPELDLKILSVDLLSVPYIA